MLSANSGSGESVGIFLLSGNVDNRLGDVMCELSASDRAKYWCMVVFSKKKCLRLKKSQGAVKKSIDVKLPYH